jgi:hypothetical protein
VASIPNDHAKDVSRGRLRFDGFFRKPCGRCASRLSRAAGCADSEHDQGAVRRRWSAEQKRAIVAESLAPGAVVTEVARRAEIGG